MTDPKLGLVFWPIVSLLILAIATYFIVKHFKKKQ